MMVAIRIFAISIALMSPVYGDLETIEGDDVDISKFNQETLFISLGSYCAPASLARSCGYRKAAFPFDWNITLDGEKLLEILNENFQNFLIDEYLVPFGWATLLNTYYHIEFVHDGSWDGSHSSFYMPILLSKYKRRIERFKKLKEHHGHVVFMRSAYINSIEDLNRFYKIKENIEISEDYALRLYETLNNYFPTLNFSLVIINNHKHQNLKIEKRLLDTLLMVRASADYTQPVMQAAYANFFNELLDTSNSCQEVLPLGLRAKP